MAEVSEPDFPLNLSSMNACEQGSGGYHAVLYRSAGRMFLEPNGSVSAKICRLSKPPNR